MKRLPDSIISDLGIRVRTAGLPKLMNHLELGEHVKRGIVENQKSVGPSNLRLLQGRFEVPHAEQSRSEREPKAQDCQSF